MTRLRWLDSRLAQDDGVVPPYTPLTVEKFTVSCLGRSLAIGRDGFPARIRSYFAPEMTRIRREAADLLAAPVALRAVDAGGRELAWTPSLTGPRLSQRGPGTVVWEADNCSGDLLMRLEARMEFDGFVDYRVAVTARRDVALTDIRLEVPYSEGCARYMMGLGFKGGVRPAYFDWAWDQKKNQDALWIGAVHAGMQVGLRAENYSRPLNTNFYLSKPLNMPPSWGNEGRGRVTVEPAAPGRTGGAKARRGRHDRVARPATVADRRDAPLRLHPAPHAVQAYRPARPLSRALLPRLRAARKGRGGGRQRRQRPPRQRRQPVHQLSVPARPGDESLRRRRPPPRLQGQDLRHRAGALQPRPELFALRSLGHEIFSTGPGGGYSWLQEHLGGDYIAAWFVPELKDAAVINSGMSRWHNYYIEGSTGSPGTSGSTGSTSTTSPSTGRP